MKRWLAMAAVTLLLTTSLAGCTAPEPAPSATTTSTRAAVLTTEKATETVPTAAATTVVTRAPTKKPVPVTKKSTLRTAPATTAPQAIIVDHTVTKPAAAPTAPSLTEQVPINKDLIPLSVKAYYGRSLLLAEGKPALVTAYDLLADGIARFQKEINVAGLGLTVEEAQKVFLYYLDDHPQQYWCDNYIFHYLANGEVIAYQPQYTMTQAQVESRQVEIIAAAAKLLDGLNDSMSDYDLELAIHDRLIKATSYDAEAKNAHDLYGALVNHRAVCDGYARALQYLLYQAGIPCLFVRGTAADERGTENHAWNVVQVGLSWYQVDATWDDPIIQKLNDPDFCSHAYFNITTAEIERDHTIVYEMAKKDGMLTSYPASYPIPECTKIDANYFLKNQQALGKFSVEELADILARCINRGDLYIQIHLHTTADAFLEFMEQNYETIWARTAEQLDPPRKRTSYSAISSTTQQVVTIRFNWQQ